MWFRVQSSIELLAPPRFGLWRERQAIVDEPARRSIRTALITGASSGIGCELAKILANQHYNLVLVGRDWPRLLSLAAELESRHGITVTPIAKDLSLPNSPAEVLAELRQRAIFIDVLINNAGFALSGEFASTNIEQTVALLHVNVVSLTHLTRLLVPGMISRRWGRVLNVASIAGFYPGPLTACYNASKAFVVSFSQALSNELQGTGVSVTCLCPGPTRTRFAQRAGLSHSKAFSENVMDAAAVAQAGYAAMIAGKPVAVSGLRNKLRMLPIPLVPNRVLAHFSRKYHEVGV
ncbi:MAG TPA: SDR family oxidoreductase [Tepidisphaeraceae bacterium]|nr:SDR family oxidoreductase [Tepidisphaeraceae bacterium]